MLIQIADLSSVRCQSLYTLYLIHSTTERYAHFADDEIKVICPILSSSFVET